MLWLALFSPDDIVRGTPVTTTKSALARVQRTTLDFGRRGSIAPYADALAATITAMRARYIAIELDEIADLFARRSTFDKLLQRALAGEIAAITKLSALPARKPFPAVGATKRADADVLHSLLGTSHIRAVAWEPAAAPPRRKPKINPGAALRDALESGDVKAARELLANGADPMFSDHFGSTFEQIFYGYAPVKMLDELLRAGARLDQKQRIRGYPLIQAASVGKPEMLRALLARGADIHVRDEFGYTALAIAAWDGHVDAVKLLLAQPFTEREREAAIRKASKSKEKTAQAAVQLIRDFAVKS